MICLINEIMRMDRGTYSALMLREPEKERLVDEIWRAMELREKDISSGLLNYFMPDCESKVELLNKWYPWVAEDLKKMFPGFFENPNETAHCVRSLITNLVEPRVLPEDRDLLRFA